VPIDRPEYGAFRDPPELHPAFKSQNRAVMGSAEWDADFAASALLIGLRAADVHDEALPGGLQIKAINCSKLRTPEPARKADEQQSAVSRVPNAVADGVKDPKEVVTEQGRGLALFDAASPPDTP
jgi:hypothetical protein